MGALQLIYKLLP